MFRTYATVTCVSPDTYETLDLPGSAVDSTQTGEAEVASLSPHDFRRTFCSDLLDAGVDIVTVASLAGHSSPQVVTQYDRRGEEVKRKAVQQLSIPRKKKR